MTCQNPRSVSVVIPVYQCEPCLEPLYWRLKQTLDALHRDYEIIFVEDCGSDSSWTLLKQLAHADLHVKAERQPENRGQHAAIASGLQLAGGEIAVVMDGDLQDPPEDIPRFVSEIEQGYDVVLGIKTATAEPWWRSLGSLAFRRMLRPYRNLPNDCAWSTFSALSRAAVGAYLAQPDRDQYYIAVLDRLPMPVSTVAYRPAERFAGRSSYSLGKLVRLALRASASRKAPGQAGRERLPEPTTLARYD